MEVPEVLDRIFYARGLFEFLEALYKGHCKEKEKSEYILKKRFIPGKGRKKDRLSAVYNELVDVFLISRQFVATPSRLGKIVDTINVLRMRSRVQWEGILKKCDVAVNIGNRACKKGRCGVIIGT